MSDSLLVLARTAFDCSDWATLSQCIQECLARQTGPAAQDIYNSVAENRLLDSGDPAEKDMIIALAVQALTLVDFQTRWTFVPLIAKFGHPAISPIMSVLAEFEPDDEEEADWDLLWFIARILGDIQHPDAVMALVQLLQTSPSEDVMTAVVMALAQQGHEAIEPLMQLLGHAATKKVAAQALAQIFVKEPTINLRESLTKITEDPDPSVRVTVIDALGHCQHPQVIECLVKASQDSVASVRQTAVTGLGMQAQGIDHTVLMPVLRSRLWDTDADVRRQTTIALSRLQTGAAADILATALNASDFPSYLKSEVVRSLVWTNTPDALNHIRTYLQTHTAKAEIYQEIAVMLGRVELGTLKLQATQLLLDLLTSYGISQQSAMLRQAIATSLGQLGQTVAEPALRQLTQDSDERVRLHAIAALRHLTPNPG